MRARVALVGGAVVVVGIGLYAHPGERAPAANRIVVVRGAVAFAPAARAPVDPGARTTGSPAPVAATEDFGDPGVWATPAEFDQSEPPS